MDENAFAQNDLSDVERRLASWTPAAQGLDLSAALFAAGRASACPSKALRAWQAAAACLAVAGLILGTGLAWERSQRLTLVAKLADNSVPVASAIIPMEPLAPSSYFVLRHKLEESTDVAALAVYADGPGSKEPSPPEPPVPRAWQPGGPSDPL